jgi:16S rRNA (guanine527-N7)-methyltransferase
VTEADAQAVIAEQFGGVIVDQMALLLDHVAEENGRQNLVAASTLREAWSRHALDSLQLLPLAGNDGGLWIDIGSGGGFPGLPVSLARTGPVLLVEPRRKRAEFLSRMVDVLGLGDRVRVAQSRIELVSDKGRIISARAVAGIEPLFEIAHHCAERQTRWLLPRGHLASEEIESLRRRWSFVFHVEQSTVSSDSRIAVFDKVFRR